MTVPPDEKVLTIEDVGIMGLVFVGVLAGAAWWFQHKYWSCS